MYVCWIFLVISMNMNVIKQHTIQHRIVFAMQSGTAFKKLSFISIKVSKFGFMDLVLNVSKSNKSALVYFTLLYILYEVVVITNWCQLNETPGRVLYRWWYADVEKGNILKTEN